MIRHTVYRDRDNDIRLQLTEGNEQLDAPDSFDQVEVSVQGTEIVEDTDSSFIDYDDEDGTLAMRLGRVPEIVALEDGVYVLEVTAFGDGNANGVAFGAFMIYLRDWGNNVT